MRTVAAMSIAMALTACTPSAPHAGDTAPTPTASQPATKPATTAPSKPESAAFTDRVWRVESSSAVAPGTLYTFLSDGTLVIRSDRSTPAYGRWTYTDGALVLIEEGMSYPADILSLDEGSFAIRSHNPGEPVDIRLVLAAGLPLPTAPPK